jgi:hypothetical protein
MSSEYHHPTSFSSTPEEQKIGKGKKRGGVGEVGERGKKRTVVDGFLVDHILFSCKWT